jgi:hypothetical protein
MTCASFVAHRISRVAQLCCDVAFAVGRETNLSSVFDSSTTIFLPVASVLCNKPLPAPDRLALIAETHPPLYLELELKQEQSALPGAASCLAQ